MFLRGEDRLDYYEAILRIVNTEGILSNSVAFRVQLNPQSGMGSLLEFLLDIDIIIQWMAAQDNSYCLVPYFLAFTLGVE